MASKSKLIGTISLFIITLFVLVALTGWFILTVFSNSVSDTLKKVYLSQAQSVGEQIGAQFFERHSDIKAVSGALEAIEGANRKVGVRLLNSYARLYRLYDLILFVDTNGDVVLHNDLDISGKELPEFKVSLDQIRGTKWFSQTIEQKLVEDPQRGLMGVYFEILDEDPFVHFLPSVEGGRAVFATTASFGNHQGVLVAYSRLTWVRLAVDEQYEKFVSLGLGDSVIRVLQDQDQVLARVGSRNFNIESEVAKSGFFIEAPVASSRFPGSIDWKIQIYTQTSEVKALIQYWRTYFLLVALVFIGLAILVTVYFGRQFSNLSSQYDQAIDVKNELELRVQERTRDLEGNLNEIKLMQKKMIAQEKMAGLGVLSTGLAHEIKNPLSILSSSAQILKNHFSGKMQIQSSEAEELCGVILKHADRIDVLVKSILISGKKNIGPRSDINLPELAEEMLSVSLRAFRIKNNMDLPHVVDFSGEDCHVVMHVEECRRILANLIDNAVFSLLKRWGYTNLEKALLKVIVRREGDWVQLVVEDNGVGIPADIQKNIFTPFFTTKEPGQGTGLGLSMSMELAKKYGGRLYFESFEGEACRFILEIPHGRV